LAPPFKEPYFSGEEHHGRYLDLHANYKDFINLKKLKESNKVKISDYLWYFSPLILGICRISTISKISLYSSKKRKKVNTKDIWPIY